MAREQLRELTTELAAHLRLLLADSPRLLLLMDRPAAADFVERIGIVVDLCDIVSSSPE